MKNKEQTFDITAGRFMASWYLNGFKRTFKTLYHVILESMEAYNLQTSAALESERKKVAVLAAALDKVNNKCLIIETKSLGGGNFQRKTEREKMVEISEICVDAILVTK